MCRSVPALLVLGVGLVMLGGCGRSSRSDDEDDGGADTAGTAGSISGRSGDGAGGKGSGQGGAGSSAGNGGVGTSGASGNGSSGVGTSGTSGAGGIGGSGGENLSGESAGGEAQSGVLTSCPSSQSTGVPCSGSFVCNYPGTCSACGCCSSATECRNGLMAYLGFSDGCMQACPMGGAGGQGGGGQAGLGGAGGEPAGVPDLSQCEAPTPCETVEQTSGEITLPPSDEALRCVVQALYDRTPGIYVQESTIISGMGPGTSTMTTVYLVKEDGTVNRISTTPLGNPQVCELQRTSLYEACLESIPDSEYATPECRAVIWAVNCTPGDVSCE